MRTQVRIFIPLFLIYLMACGQKTTQDEVIVASVDEPIGAVKYVLLEDPLEAELIVEGKTTYEQKCIACHYLNDEKLVAPGWADITNRREPAWIMNMILNVNIMLEVDSIACELLEENETRMPEQHLTIDQARSVLEFMRQNDIEQVGAKDKGNKVM
jgi:mono/diheme cytochrome c family protein